MSTIIRWNPIRELNAMQTAMDRLFNENWRMLRPSWDEAAREATYALPLDVHENDTAYLVITELAGVNPDQINVKMHDGVLTIEAELPQPEIKEGSARVLLQERRFGKFSRSVRLPLPVDVAKIEAAYADGILTLTLPKVEEAQPRVIQVKAGRK